MRRRAVYSGEVPDEEWLREFTRVSEGGPLEVTVVSDGGPWAVHDMPCAVCGEHKAILDLNQGVFQPCAACRHAGWQLVRTPARRWPFGRRG